MFEIFYDTISLGIYVIGYQFRDFNCIYYKLLFYHRNDSKITRTPETRYGVVVL